MLANYEKRVRIYDVMKRYIGKVIDEHKLTNDPEQPRDFTDVYVTDLAKSNEMDEFNEKDLALCMIDFLAAGTETSSTTMKWIVLFLTVHQDTQDKY